MDARETGGLLEVSCLLACVVYWNNYLDHNRAPAPNMSPIHIMLTLPECVTEKPAEHFCKR